MFQNILETCFDFNFQSIITLILVSCLTFVFILLTWFVITPNGFYCSFGCIIWLPQSCHEFFKEHEKIRQEGVKKIEERKNKKKLENNDKTDKSPRNVSFFNFSCFGKPFVFLFKKN
jgi:hypothetical protein